MFTVQTERVVPKTIRSQSATGVGDWEKARFRHTRAGCTVTIHEHQDGIVSVRWGPHVVGRFSAAGASIAAKRERRGKRGSLEAGENRRRVFTASHPSLEISRTTRDSHFHRAGDDWCPPQSQSKSERPSGLNRTDRVLNKNGHLDVLTTARVISAQLR